MNSKKILLAISTYVFLLLLPMACSAGFWANLWQRPDQQGASALLAGEPKLASELFVSPSWKATAYYRSANYTAAAHSFNALKTAEGFYNEGNALAHDGDLHGAINAYTKALAMNPHNKDAQYNRNLLKNFLKHQKKQPSQNTSQQQHTKNEKESSPQTQPQSQQASKMTPDENKNTNPNQNPHKVPSSQKNTADKKEHLPLQEEEQATEQWLQRIPDNPGGLLRQKFIRDHLRRLTAERHS